MNRKRQTEKGGGGRREDVEEREREKVSQTDQQAVRQRFSDSRSLDRHKANFTHTHTFTVKWKRKK